MKIAILGGTDSSLIVFRGALLRTMVAQGHNVVASAGVTSEAPARKLRDLGVRFIPLPLMRAGLSPLSDVNTIIHLRKFFRMERPDLLLAYTIKPVVYGIPAARRAGVLRCFALITGLGSAFFVPGIRGQALAFAAGGLYRYSLRLATKVIVQNKDIEVFFRQRGILSADAVCELVPGSGVDLAKFGFVPLPPEGPATFVMIARLLGDKGVFEFVEAARKLKNASLSARFVLVGSRDANPSAVTEKQLKDWKTEGVVECIDHVEDVRPVLRASTVFVLPSYHEGLPRATLEAMACGRAVITTDAMGCRETIRMPGAPDATGVRTGLNGLLVPARNAEALAAAMARLTADRPLIAEMGRHARETAEQFFDVELVNQMMLRTMGIASQATTSR